MPGTGHITLEASFSFNPLTHLWRECWKSIHFTDKETVAWRTQWPPEIPQLGAGIWVQVNLTSCDAFFDENRAGIIILIFLKRKLRLRRVWRSVLVSCGYCNNLPPIWWLKATEFCFLTGLEARSLKSVLLDQNRDVGRVSSAGSRGESVPGLFQLLMVAGVPWLVAASLQSLPLSSHGLLLCVSQISLCGFLVRALVIEFRAHLDNFNPGDLISRSLI